MVKGRYLKYTKILLIIVLKPYGDTDSTWQCHTNKNNNNMAASNVRKLYPSKILYCLSENDEETGNDEKKQE